jgi:hypothetical protein
MSVDIVIGERGGVQVQAASVAIVGGLHAVATQIGLAATALVVTLGTADEASLGVPECCLAIRAVVTRDVGASVGIVVHVHQVVYRVSCARIHHHAMTTNKDEETNAN